ncbi:hypothetical protein ACFXPN_47445 [Streptomyces griseorubiginosus]|uniref:hypothetical protein n=1 Tax=Streptomyces griseorubiginosus TaxID=67304 RepID=UPI0036ACF14F
MASENLRRERATRNPLSPVRDAVHGLIDTSDTAAGFVSPVIDRVIQSRPVQRLRRVKQLGFASHSFVGADHSRYAHAIGTMHIMRKLLRQVGGVDSEFLAALEVKYNRVYQSDQPAETEWLYEHILIAALLQDVGELPYQSATRGLFVPDDDVRSWVGQKIGQDTSLWPAKPVFTLACLFGAEIDPLLAPLNSNFIAFLMTADYWSDSDLATAFLPVRHMLDGEIDADRIDYVHRDAHHTVGMLGNSDDVISAVITYDDQGPICSDPAPFANFLATRAHLYSTVYFAPQNRFRVMLVKSILRGVRESQELRQAFPLISNQYMSTDSFLEVDDVRLEEEITKLSQSALKSRLSKRAGTALTEFTTGTKLYRHFWLRDVETVPTPATPADVPVPHDLFFEVFAADAPPSSGVRFSMEGPDGEVELAGIGECNGPHFGVTSNARATLPILGDVLVFYPHNGKGEDIKAVRAAYTDRTLRAALLQKARNEWDGIPPDTRSLKGFNGPTIFISYCTDDIVEVRRLVSQLHHFRRRYFVIMEANQGIGGTTARNSIDGVMNTDSAILVASRSYQQRCSTQLNGNIMHEIRTMHDRRSSSPNDYPVVPVSIHPHYEVSNIPWTLLGMDAPPFTGTVIGNASDTELRVTVEAALAVIDAAIGSRS